MPINIDIPTSSMESECPEMKALMYWKNVFALILFCSFQMNNAGAQTAGNHAPQAPFLIVLGIAQDGGVPQAGTSE
ncbi:MAG: hypothetical protein ACE5HI_04760, partial [bacterium]